MEFLDGLVLLDRIDGWIALSGLQSSLVDWIVIDNPFSKLYFRFGLSIRFSISIQITKI